MSRKLLIETIIICTQREKGSSGIMRRMLFNREEYRWIKKDNFLEKVKEIRKGIRKDQGGEKKCLTFIIVDSEHRITSLKEFSPATTSSRFESPMGKKN